MALPSKDTEEALKKVTAHLECSICLDTYTHPKLLPCFHAFCQKCLEGLVVQDHDGHINHLFEIQAALTKVKEPQKMHCEKCKKSTATSYCRDCGNFVCDKCNELHQIWEEFADHQIASLSDIQ